MCVSTSAAITSGGRQLIFVLIIHRRNLLIRRQFLTGDPMPRWCIISGADVPWLGGMAALWCAPSISTIHGNTVSHPLPRRCHLYYTTDVLHESQSVLTVMHCWRFSSSTFLKNISRLTTPVSHRFS